MANTSKQFLCFCNISFLFHHCAKQSYVALYLRKNPQADNAVAIDIQYKHCDLEGKNKLQKAIYYLKHYGMVYTLKKAMRKIGIPVSQMSEYMAWCKKNATPPQMLEIQAKSDITQIMTLVVVAGGGAGFKRGGWERQTCPRVILAGNGKRARVSFWQKLQKAER